MGGSVSNPFVPRLSHPLKVDTDFQQVHYQALNTRKIFMIIFQYLAGVKIQIRYETEDAQNDEKIKN